MILAILRHTPTWVWGLLASLLLLGAWQTRSRRVPRAQLLALPLSMLALGLWSSVPAFLARPVTLLAWAGALAAAAWAGSHLRAPSGARWDAAAARLHLPGSWLPMLLIVSLFSLRYGVSVGLALAPAWRDATAVLLPVALLYGAIGGLLLGRALALLRLTRAAPQGAWAAALTAP